MEKVTSKDGTTIAYDKTGQGPAIILVGGATATRSSDVGLAELLAPDFTVYYFDRRGRGDSTDTKPYGVDKEIEDIEALIDAAGSSAYLYGISSGGALALEAAIKLGDKVKKLAIYEAPYDSSAEGIKAWEGYRTGLTKALDAGNRSDAVAIFMKFVGVPDGMLEGMRHSPMWPSMEAVAPTLAYDAAVLGEDRVVPIDRVTKITAQTLILDGSDSMELMPFMRISAEALAKAIPGAAHQVLEGQQHNVDMKILAPVLAKFFKS